MQHCEQHFRHWTPVATRERDTPDIWTKLEWVDLIDAPLSSEQARQLAKEGRLLIACRHYADRIEMMVRSPPATPSDPGKPASSVNAAFRLAGRAHRGAW